MFRAMLKSKIHRATVTEANVDYMGSITIDEKLMELADLLPGEKVLVADLNNGARFETYVVKGRKGSGVICINGAAAKLAGPGDLVIIMSFSLVDDKEAAKFIPKIVFVDEKNKPC